MRVIPSVAVAAIEAIYPWAKGNSAPSGLNAHNAPEVGAVLALVEAIPDELLPRDPGLLARFGAALGAMRGALHSWGGGSHVENLSKLNSSAAFDGTNAVGFVAKVLRNCPDQAATLSTADLAFIEDPDARESMRLDIAEAKRAHSNADYKSATVLAGSVIEALLLWGIEHIATEANVSDAIAAWKREPSSSANAKILEREPDQWRLFEYIQIAHRVAVITDQTRDAALLAKDYRNLIHPGLVRRAGSKCTIGTSFGALGAMEEVVREITSKA